jgi:hypothetical protein
MYKTNKRLFIYLTTTYLQFHQMVRAMTPVFTVMLSIVFLQKSYPRKIYISLLPVSKLNQLE